MTTETNGESVDEGWGNSDSPNNPPHSKSQIVRWGPAVLIAAIALGFGGLELLIFTRKPGTGTEVFAESLIIPLLISGLILIVLRDFDSLVTRLLYASMFVLLLHAVTETADELVRPPLTFSLVFEHIGLIVGLGLLFAALWKWSESRQERQEELTNVRDLLNQTEYLANVGGWELDCTTDELRWTDGTYRIHDLSTDYDLTLEKALSFYHPDDRSQITDLYERCSEDGIPFQTEQRLVTRANQTRWVRVTSEAITEGEEVVRLQGAIQDITAEKERRQRLDVLTRILRHNFRNDLTVIRGRAKILLEEFSKLNDLMENRANEGEANTEQLLDRDRVEELVENTQLIMEKSDELVTLGEKIRRYGDLTSTTETVEPTQLRPMLESVCADVATSYPDASIQVDCPSNVTVLSTSVYFETAIEELVENSIVHSASNEQRVEITATPPEDGQVEIHIRDWGPGMPANERAILEGDKETDLQHGSGVGIWVANWLIGYQGGTVSISNSDEDGTTVRITLPAVSETELAMSKVVGTNGSRTIAGKSKKDVS